MYVQAGAHWAWMGCKVTGRLTGPEKVGGDNDMVDTETTKQKLRTSHDANNRNEGTSSKAHHTDEICHSVKPIAAT